MGPYFTLYYTNRCYDYSDPIIIYGEAINTRKVSGKGSHHRGTFQLDYTSYWNAMNCDITTCKTTTERICNNFHKQYQQGKKLFVIYKVKQVYFGWNWVQKKKIFLSNE